MTLIVSFLMNTFEWTSFNQSPFWIAADLGNTGGCPQTGEEAFGPAHQAL